MGNRLDSTALTPIEGGDMAGKTDFTEDEWGNLQQGVTGAGLLVSTAHRDFTDTFGEASTVARQLAAHRDSESQLVRELSGTHRTGFGLVASPKEVVEGTTKALGAAVAVLRAKAPDELEAYRRLVLDVATAVAEAKGGVKEEETTAIESITAALGEA
jgi:tellurite resistance protein